MNSDPLSESMPRMGNGNCAATCSMASNTQMAALFLTDRLMVQPVAMSVTVRVKQNSPDELPPSWPTRSISTNPGDPLIHSAQVRIGIWDLSNVPGLVWERPRNPRAARSGASSRSMVAALIDTKRAASSSLITRSPSLRIQGHDDGQHRSEALAGGTAAQHPTDSECGYHIWRELRRPGSPRHNHLDRPCTPEGGPGVVPVPARELDQLVENPGLLDPRSPLVGGRQLLGHCLALSHRKLHDVTA